MIIGGDGGKDLTIIDQSHITKSIVNPLKGLFIPTQLATLKCGLH